MTSNRAEKDRNLNLHLQSLLIRRSMLPNIQLVTTLTYNAADNTFRYGGDQRLTPAHTSVLGDLYMQHLM